MSKLTSKIKKQLEQTTYPCLMISDRGNVVLFTDECKGTVVSNKPGNYEVGYHCTEWTMPCFKPFYGTIELTQD